MVTSIFFFIANMHEIDNLFFYSLDFIYEWVYLAFQLLPEQCHRRMIACLSCVFTFFVTKYLLRLGILFSFFYGNYFNDFNELFMQKGMLTVKGNIYIISHNNCAFFSLQILLEIKSIHPACGILRTVISL